jgi:hypothetical protein
MWKRVCPMDGCIGRNVLASLPVFISSLCRPPRCILGTVAAPRIDTEVYRQTFRPEYSFSCISSSRKNGVTVSHQAVGGVWGRYR